MSDFSDSESKDDDPILERDFMDLFNHDQGGDDNEREAAWQKFEALQLAEHRELMIEELVWRGIPSSRRATQWRRLSGAPKNDAFSVLPEGSREGETSPAAVPPRVAADIEMDIPRASAPRRYWSSLRRVLLAFARQNSNVGYCQGLNVIAATMLAAISSSRSQVPSTADEATVVDLLLVLTSERCRSWWNSDMSALQRDVAHRTSSWSRLCETIGSDDEVDESLDFFNATRSASRTEQKKIEKMNKMLACNSHRDIDFALKKLFKIQMPLDLVLTQWLLTIFAHAGNSLASARLRLRALDLALCAPGGGVSALLALALAVVAHSAPELRRATDMVKAANALESTMVNVDAEVLCALGHALSRDPRYALFEQSPDFERSEGLSTLERPLMSRIDPLALWLEAARRVSVDAVFPLEGLIKQSVPSLATSLDEARALADVRIKDTENAPLAVFCCEVSTLNAALRLVSHILGPPVDLSSSELKISPELPVSRSGISLYFFEWGDTCEEYSRLSSKDDTSICVTYLRSPRPALRRFSLVLLVTKPLIKSTKDIHSMEYTFEANEDVEDDDEDSDSINDNDSEYEPDHKTPQQITFLKDLRARADAVFVVIELSEDTKPSRDLGSKYFPDHESRYILVAGNLARSGFTSVFKAVGSALLIVSQSKRRSIKPAPEFFVLGPLDSRLRRSKPCVPLALSRNVLAHDERRLLRIFAALPRARALKAVDALLARAREIRIHILTLEAIVHQQSKWWWRRPWHFSPFSPQDVDSCDARAQKMFDSLDAADLRAISADEQIPLKACRAALRDLDRHKWTSLYSNQMAASLDNVVNTQLPLLLESATALSRNADRAARTSSVCWTEVHDNCDDNDEDEVNSLVVPTALSASLPITLPNAREEKDSAIL